MTGSSGRGAVLEDRVRLDVLGELKVTLYHHYGYHRVTVNGPETQVDFIEVNKGQQVNADGAPSQRPTCPKIGSADVG